MIREPDYADAWMALAYLRLDGYRFGFDRETGRERALSEARHAAKRAVAIKRDNPLALLAWSAVQHYSGEYEQSIANARRAIELNPYDPITLAGVGWRLVLRGHHEEDLGLLERAIERSAGLGPSSFYPIAGVRLMEGNYAAMLEAAETSTVDGMGSGYALLAIAHGYLGNAEPAAAALQQMAEASPLLPKDPAAVFTIIMYTTT